MISGRRAACLGLAKWLLLLALIFGSSARPALSADVANSIVAEADLAKALQKELQIEAAGNPVELASDRVKMVVSDPRNRNELIAILNDVGFDAPDTDDDGNTQSDFTVETILTLKGSGEEVNEMAHCNWISSDKLRAQCSVDDGGGGFAIRVVGRGAGLKDINWQVIIGEGLAVGYRAGFTESGEGPRLDYLIRINGRDPVVAPLVIR
jgi:hypothetical protein